MSILRTPQAVLVRAWLPILVIVIWSILVALNPSPFFPSPWVIAQKFQENWLFARFTSDVVPSLIVVLGGYGFALLFGITIGVLLGLVPRVEWVVDPVAQFWRALPGLALIPLVLVIGGIGIAPKLYLVALGAFWPILLNTIDGVRSIEPEVGRMSAVYRVPVGIRLRHIVLPGALPQIMAGARIGLGVAMVVMVGSELYAATAGIGFFVLQAQQTFAMADMWSAIVLLGVLGYLLSVAFGLVERRVVHWSR